MSRQPVYTLYELPSADYGIEVKVMIIVTRFYLNDIIYMICLGTKIYRPNTR